MSNNEKDGDPLADKEELQRHIRAVLAAEKPQGRSVEFSYKLIKRLFNPMILGADNLPDRPCLFVANHAFLALDGIIITPILLNEFGRFINPLVDRAAFALKKIGDSVQKGGAAMGHPEVCSALMEAGRDVMVFPGGAHEAFKPASEIYRLKWKDRYGFVRLAVKHGYTIMPLALIGPDEFYGHLMEGKDLPDSLLGKLLKRLGILTEDTRQDLLPPIPVGALGTLIPKPQRCYLGLGKPVDLSAEKGKRLGKRRLLDIRQQVADEIESQLAELLLIRTQHRGEDSLLRRILTI